MSHYQSEHVTTVGGFAGYNLARRVWAEFRDDDIPGQAAKVAYYAFLAMPPTFMVLFGLAGFFGGQDVANWLTGQLGTALPAAAAELVETFVQQVVHEKAPGPFSVGLVLALWGASAVFMGLGDTLNRAYDTTETRSWVRRRLIAIGVMVGFLLLFLGGSAALLAGPQIARGLGLGPLGSTIWAIVQWPLALGFVVAAFWIVYYFLPDRAQDHVKPTLLKAAAIAAVLWIIATALFRLYISRFASYSETYGFLGAVIVLLLWLYVTGIVVLTGGEIASEMEKDVGPSR